MPIDFRFRGTGFDTTLVVMNSASNQVYVFTLPKMPTSFELDPNNWIVKSSSGIMVNVDRISEVPQTYALLQNYPNPFNPSTVIPFDLPKASQVRLEIYNGLGELVTMPVKDQAFEAGHHSIVFSPVSVSGSSLSSGVYYCRMLVSGVPVQTMKMILVR
jgi:hypothetical protein